MVFVRLFNLEVIHCQEIITRIKHSIYGSVKDVVLHLMSKLAWYPNNFVKSLCYMGILNICVTAMRSENTTLGEFQMLEYFQKRMRITHPDIMVGVCRKC